MLHELWTARAILSKPGNRSDLVTIVTRSMTWSDYLDDVGLNRMTTDQEKNDHLNNIIAWANEITLFLHKGMITEVDGNCIRRGFIDEIECCPGA